MENNKIDIYHVGYSKHCKYYIVINLDKNLYLFYKKTDLFTFDFIQATYFNDVDKCYKLKYALSKKYGYELKTIKSYFVPTNPGEDYPPNDKD